MNQPDLGLKVSVLRQQKGLTQEQLAELCEVSPYTIQSSKAVMWTRTPTSCIARLFAHGIILGKEEKAGV
jgi:transcriptional regulator with XRE-family HTH domain